MSAWPDQRVALFGRTNFRNTRRVFGIKQADRRSHMYLIGKTGTGKSTLLEALIRQDIGSGQGVMLCDPHGDLAERVLARLPERRRGDLIDFNVADPGCPIAFNPLHAVPPAKRPLAASFLLDAFKKLWPDFWGPRLEHVLRHALLALLDQPQASLADVLRLLDDRAFRRAVAERVYNPQVRAFWLGEYEGYPVRLRAEAIAPLQNKVGAFLAEPALQRVLLQPRSSFDLREVMDEGRVLIVNLARGRLGETASSLLGALLVSAVGLAALSRADVVEEDRRDFFVFLDEFQAFATLSLVTMLAELRKYRVGLVLAHQHLEQLDPRVRAAVLGNVGTIVAFRLGPSDAEVLEKEFAPELRVGDLLRLPNREVYIRLLIDGVVSRPFSAEVLTVD